MKKKIITLFGALTILLMMGVQIVAANPGEQWQYQKETRFTYGSSPNVSYLNAWGRVTKTITDKGNGVFRIEIDGQAKNSRFHSFVIDVGYTIDGRGTAQAVVLVGRDLDLHFYNGDEIEVDWKIKVAGVGCDSISGYENDLGRYSNGDEHFHYTFDVDFSGVGSRGDIKISVVTRYVLYLRGEYSLSTGGYVSFAGVYRSFNSDFEVSDRNDAPNKPSIAAGPTSGAEDAVYSFSFYGTDPNIDRITFEIDWGDGQITADEVFYSSGTTKSFSHTWKDPGDYVIEVRIQDEHGLWSTTLYKSFRAVVLLYPSPPTRPGPPGLW